MDPSRETARPATRRGAVWPWVVGLALPPALIAVIQLGRLHPDEVYQALEPAYFRAHGYGILAWEWQRGLRNWAVPGLFAWLLKLCDAVGITHPRVYRAVLEVPQYLLHVWALSAAYRYLRRHALPEASAVPALIAVALYGPVVAFAGRTLSESFSTAFLLIAVEALDREERPRRAGLLGGVALGLSVVTRYGSAVVVIAALAWLVFKRRWATLYYAVFGGAVVAAALGVLDRKTWGTPFHSFRAYFEFNVASGGAAQQFGASPWWTYFAPLAGQLPVWGWLALPFVLRKPGMRLSLPLFCALVYVAVLSATPHKELRFLYPALVLLTLTAAVGLPQLLERLRPPGPRTFALTLALIVGFIPFFFQAVENGLRGDQLRAIVRATRPDDATGLLIVGEGVWGAGGYFYIGKNIPWTVADWPQDRSFRLAMRDARFNRIVTYDERALTELQQQGFRIEERIGRATILAR